MYKLPETPEDFNAKYTNSIGILAFINDTTKKLQDEPIYVGQISNYRDGAAKILNYHRIVESGGLLHWVAANIRLAKVVDLIFPMPAMGYHVQPGYFPSFMDRRCVRTVHRGWSDGSLTLNAPSIFSRLERYDYQNGNKIFTGPSDPNFVRAALSKPLYVDIASLKKDMPFAALSRDFLAVNAGDRFGIYYQNFLVGYYKDNALVLDDAVRELSDVFQSQVEM